MSESRLMSFGERVKMKNCHDNRLKLRNLYIFCKRIFCQNSFKVRVLSSKILKFISYSTLDYGTLLIDYGKNWEGYHDL